jgi:hypothetical protein
MTWRCAMVEPTIKSNNGRSTPVRRPPQCPCVGGDKIPFSKVDNAVPGSIVEAYLHHAKARVDSGRMCTAKIKEGKEHKRFPYDRISLRGAPDI